jgi:hypothetical protein
MRNVIGAVLMGVGFLAMFAVWIYTTVIFFATGETLFGLLSLFVPPADLVLPFLISVPLGLIGIGGTLVAFLGAALRQD